MAISKTLEDIITEQAPIVSEQIEAAVAFADSEEDLRIEVEKAIEVFRKEADLPELKGHHEVTIGKGRADSVYDYVFIEYKKPGRLKESNDAPGNREVIKQLQDRAKAFKSELKRDPKELFGVGTDGDFFITGRYRNGKWEISPARERSVYVVEDFLRKLSSLGVAGKPFLPEYLAGDFGAESERKLAREGIEKLYWRIREVDKQPDAYPKAKVLFDQWRILFGEVCGYDIKSPSSKIKQLGEFYGVKKDPNAAALLFAVHSYYALFMKFLAAEIATLFNPLSTSFLARLHQTGSTEKLCEELRELEDGGIYRHLRITNFLEGDLFSWYLDAWNGDIERVIRQMVACLDEYDPKTLSIDPIESRDLLKKLYQQLFPQTVRHDLGEYYTPDWLAEHVLNEVGYAGDPDKRLLDPACGSGTFLVMAISKVRQHADKNMIPKHELLPKILKNIVGFDLNPLAVMAARTNYLMALRELLKLGGEIEIPVYLCDSIMTPAEYGELITKEGTATGGIGKVQELKTSAGRFMIPTEIAQSRQTVAAYTEELEHCVRGDYSEDEFISRLKGERIPLDSEDLHKTLYRQVLRLKKQNQNDIWARIIKNSFAPLFVEPADYIVGNPPWVNWDNLPDDYRDDTKMIWINFGLFSLTGTQGKLGGGKKDISMLFVYQGMKTYLGMKGRLGFLITQSVFKTEGSADGFRKFSYPLQGGVITSFAVFKVCDMSAIQPFEGATNRTSIICCEPGGGTKYPVETPVWIPVKKARIDQDLSLGEVKKRIRVVECVSLPVIESKLNSPWLTTTRNSLPGLKKAMGTGGYSAQAGATTCGADGVFLIKPIHRSNSNVLIANFHDAGKKEINSVKMSVDEEFIYPVCRGKDVRRWATDRDKELFLLMVQDPKRRVGVEEAPLKTTYKNTYTYLSHFKKVLEGRKSKILPKNPFYSIYGLDTDTLVPVKVVWGRVANTVEAAVLGSEDHPWSSNHTVVPFEAMIIPCRSKREAYYICACLNSCISNMIVKGSIALHPDTHVLRRVAIPQYNASAKEHVKLSELGEHCHASAAKGDSKTLGSLEAEVDEAAAQLWGIMHKELEEIQKALKLLSKT